MQPNASKGGFRQRTQELRPTIMQRGEQQERTADRTVRVGQPRPKVFVVGLQHGRRFGRHQLVPHVCIDVAVGNVVHDLPRTKTTSAIRRVELVRFEAAHSIMQQRGQGRDLTDCRSPLNSTKRALHRQLADRIPGIVRRSAHGLLASTSIRIVPCSTFAPSLATTLRTMPASPAHNLCSIFIAVSTASV